MYDSTPDNTESTDPTSNASTITRAVLDTVEHLQSKAGGDRGASVGAVIETVLEHTSHETTTVVGEVNQLLADGEIYRSDGDGKRIKLTKVVADGGQASTVPDNADLTRFQQGLLRILAREGELYGLAIKRQLEAERGEEINHGQIYPNLDTLVEDGLIDKRAVDKRTNNYQLTDDGRELVRRLAQQWLTATDGLSGGEA